MTASVTDCSLFWLAVESSHDGRSSSNSLFLNRCSWHIWMLHCHIFLYIMNIQWPDERNWLDRLLSWTLISPNVVLGNSKSSPRSLLWQLPAIAIRASQWQHFLLSWLISNGLNTRFVCSSWLQPKFLSAWTFVPRGWVSCSLLIGFLPCTRVPVLPLYYLILDFLGLSLKPQSLLGICSPALDVFLLSWRLHT